MISWCGLIHNLVTVASTASETDDDVFPLTPDSKRSANPRCITDTLGRAGSPTPSWSPKQPHVSFQKSHFHLYRRVPAFQERRIFECKLASPDSHSSTEDMKAKVVPLCLKIYITNYMHHISRPTMYF